MSWIDLIDNPRIINSLYSFPPQLNQLTLVRFDLEQAKSWDFRTEQFLTILLKGREIPDKPKKWRKCYPEAVWIRFWFWEVKRLRLSGWEPEGLLTLDFAKREDGLIEFHGKSAKCQIVGSCRSFSIEIKPVKE